MDTNTKKELLERYGHLYNAVNFPPALVKDLAQKRKALEACQQEMARHNLSHQDYLDHKDMQRYLQKANRLIAEENRKKNEMQSDTIRIIGGILLIIIGLALTSMSDGKVLFYGAIFVGIGLIISGIIGISANKEAD
jgi:hypothetical protein